MISVISTFASTSFLRWNVISHMEFSQKSIQIAININHSNPHQHIHPIKPYSNLLINHLQMSQMLPQNLAKMFQKFTNMTIQPLLEPLLDSIYYMMWFLIICIMHWAYSICGQSYLLHVIMYIIQSEFVVNGYILNVIYHVMWLLIVLIFIVHLVQSKFGSCVMEFIAPNLQQIIQASVQYYKIYSNEIESICQLVLIFMTYDVFLFDFLLAHKTQISYP
eukprot:419510_1